ncbi:MAG: class I tRNA ligase family protein [Candidatus Vogelbacteria bacterium]|nr:class I tRNA ligase family protein [Candidatus Vogelbacteria bacterium]
MAEEKKSAIAEREEKILEFWKKRGVFKSSLEKPAPKGEFVFYEGPPTANGKPGIHHLEARAFKDAIPRYRTMRGYHVRRKAGWDTHGLPVELEVEKQLGLKSKKDIEAYGVAAFNAKCKESVWKYLEEWNRFTERIGFWLDQEHPYVTYSPQYIESLWAVFGSAHRQGLVYKDYKVLPWCPRCGTALSSHELAQGYKDVKDLSVFVKFKLEVGQKTGHFVSDDATYVLAWTTTPWTLPGNVALAVGRDIDYAIVRKDGECFVAARDCVAKLFQSGGYDEVAVVSGADMVGARYEPLYPYMASVVEGEDKKRLDEKAYRVYAADFVTTGDGTGIVHTAVMYGQDDFLLGTEVGLPKHHLVNLDGTFIDEADFLAKRFVKDEAVAVDIIKDLARRGRLFGKEKYEHSYPHCWRCNTPVIYYARDSWYIRMSQLREVLVAENERINWVPEHIKEGRFGEWLREIKDWAISRERYWGTPLPIWESELGQRVFVDSLDTLKRFTKKSGNSYLLMRHGEADNNVAGKVSSVRNNSARLTDEGKRQVREAAERLRAENIDLIFASPLLRIKETVAIVQEALALPDERVVYDERLREIEAGQFEHKTWEEYYAYFGSLRGAFEHSLQNGENLQQVKERSLMALYDIDAKHSGKRILLIGHGGPLRLLLAGAGGGDVSTLVEMITRREFLFDNAEVHSLSFVRLPINERFELDLHRPYVDEIELEDEDGARLRRAPEVMDVWFDSGAMPFAQDHFPFSTPDILYPADYISEAIDQTRGWFYTLHAVGALMGRGKAFKNVVCLGHILDAQGKKMSKSVGNVVDPWNMLARYGADPLRFWMYSVNQPGDSKNFDEKTVDEIVKRVFNLLENVTRFYELYANNGAIRTLDDEEGRPKSRHILDRWIRARLNSLIASMTRDLDQFRLLEPSRAIREFIADLSQWYVRRSRDRFKEETDGMGTGALGTTRFVLETLAKLMAPLTPFAAEDVYSRVRGARAPESVHLADWPSAEAIDDAILIDMERTRALVARALEARARAGIKIRQPLARLIINEELSEDFRALIRDEVNVEEVVVDTASGGVALDTNITPLLRERGDVREIVRAVQDLRKGEGLSPHERITIAFSGDASIREFIANHGESIARVVNADRVSFMEDAGQEVLLGAGKIFLSIKRA